MFSQTLKGKRKKSTTQYTSLKTCRTISIDYILKNTPVNEGGFGRAGFTRFVVIGIIPARDIKSLPGDWHRTVSPIFQNLPQIVKAFSCFKRSVWRQEVVNRFKTDLTFQILPKKIPLKKFFKTKAYKIINVFNVLEITVKISQ